MPACCASIFRPAAARHREKSYRKSRGVTGSINSMNAVLPREKSRNESAKGFVVAKGRRKNRNFCHMILVQVYDGVPVTVALPMLACAVILALPAPRTNERNVIAGGICGQIYFRNACSGLAFQYSSALACRSNALLPARSIGGLFPNAMIPIAIVGTPACESGFIQSGGPVGDADS